VKIWSKDGTRGCNNPPKTFALPPSLYVHLNTYSSRMHGVNVSCLLLDELGSLAHYIVISTVLVKIWSKNRRRDCSDLLVFYSHVEKASLNYSPNPKFELLFAKQSHANQSKNISLLAHHASNNKNKIIAHPTGHGNAHFGRTQQPTNNTAALIYFLR
jgi:hypothetical protein